MNVGDDKELIGYADTKDMEWGLFGMEKSDFVDGDLEFLTTPGREDVLTLTPAGGTYGFPGGCSIEMTRESQQNRPGC